MNTSSLEEYINQVWDESIINELVEFIKIPNKSPMFDANWAEHGYMDQAVNLIKSWCEQREIPGLTLEVVRLKGRTPLIYMEIPGQIDKTVLLYGHLDKQPEMTGWDEDLGPWKPVIKDNKLYGRGGADDGYAAYASLTAIESLIKQNLPIPRCVVIIEACEESGSYDLPYYVEELQTRIGSPELVICLDSMCGNYDQLWVTTSLRGLVGGELKVELLRKGMHSGQASGVVPDSFRVIRQLLSRIEDENTGKITLDAACSIIPEQRIEQAELAAEVLGNKVRKNYPFIKGVESVPGENSELILNRSWRAALSITGQEGLPDLTDAGNVSRPQTSLMLSMRIPPNVEADAVAVSLKEALESNPPYNAKVEFKPDHTACGWDAPEVADWLHESANNASQTFFGKPVVYLGEGGSIPFMGMLGEKFPTAQFVVTGVLGPKSNAHGPNEFLHIPMAKKVTACVAKILADYGQSNDSKFNN